MSYLNTEVPELKGYDTGTVLGNLELLESRLENLLEANLSELSELAEAILSDASEDPDTVFSILLSLRGHPDEGDGSSLKSRHLLPENHPELTAMTRHLGLYERLILYRILSRKLLSLPTHERVEADPLPSVATGRIAYMPGAFSDKAYIHFAEHIPHCRAATFHSFVDACEEVWGGLCEYCILPLENTVDGKLIGFSRLMIKYRLQITAVCDIHGAAGGRDSTTRFALLKSAGNDWERTPSPMESAKHPPAYLELLHVSAHPQYSEIMAAAEFCGLSPIRVDTLPDEDVRSLLTQDTSQTTHAQHPISTVWNVLGADLSAFLCYLALEVSDDPILGLYPLI